MAMLFGLQIECGQESAARAMAAHFLGVALVLPDGLALRCESSAWRDVEGNWWVSAAPPGASASGIPGRDVPELRKADRMTQIGFLLYDSLRAAPDFRYALAGVEASEFRYFSELNMDLVDLDFPGLVLCDAIWAQLNRAEVFQPFRPGYVWRPYQGETQDL
jgi:hypothetical protein